MTSSIESPGAHVLLRRLVERISQTRWDAELGKVSTFEESAVAQLTVQLFLAPERFRVPKLTDESEGDALEVLWKMATLDGEETRFTQDDELARICLVSALLFIDWTIRGRDLGFEVLGDVLARFVFWLGMLDLEVVELGIRFLHQLPIERIPAEMPGDAYHLQIQLAILVASLIASQARARNLLDELERLRGSRGIPLASESRGILERLNDSGRTIGYWRQAITSAFGNPVDYAATIARTLDRLLT